MSRLTIDHALLAKRGANLCGEDELQVVACSQCGHHYLHNRTINDIYYDPMKLSRRFFLLPGVSMPPCSGCGQSAWQEHFSVVPDTEVLVGPWGWIFLCDE